MKMTVKAWDNGAPIPARFAFGDVPSEGRFAPAGNMNPHIAWRDAPAGTKSFAIIVHDPDVPSSSEDVNREGKIVPAELPRVDFYHWVLVDIPADAYEIAEGADSAGVTAKGKTPGVHAHGRTGVNGYTDWFAGDPDMGGDYGGYDGPCPPWNDSIIHHYHFSVYALNVAKLNLEGAFTGAQALTVMKSHVLDQCTHIGTYSMNPTLRSFED